MRIRLGSLLSEFRFWQEEGEGEVRRGGEEERRRGWIGGHGEYSGCGLSHSLKGWDRFGYMEC
jgi:hypothetical protein